MSVSPFITPTYQSNLNGAIRDVIVALNRGETWGAWEALKSLYYLSPPSVMEECGEMFKKIEQELETLSRYKNLDATLQQSIRSRKIYSYLYKRNFEFLGVIKKQLYDKGYLERPDWGRIQKKDYEELEEETGEAEVAT